MNRLVLVLIFLLLLPLPSRAQERSNFFDDPFMQVTSSMPGCPVPEGPLKTQAEVRAEAHVVGTQGKPPYRPANAGIK